jgi:SAM-dependent methyltransferase
MHISSHWHGYAAHWDKLSSPLRPHSDDTRTYAQELSPQARTLLLGVTPEIAQLGLSGVAVDRNAQMIEQVWPRPANWKVTQGQWLQLPLPDRSVQQAVGDGALTMMRFPQEYPLLLSELRRVLRPCGKIVLRLFAASEQTESLSDIRRALDDGRIRSFHAFKWRLAMSLAQIKDGNVQVAELLDVFNQMFADGAGLLAQTGWPAQVLDTINIYKHSSATLSFPRRSEVHAVLAQYARDIRYRLGSYELGECCPIVVLEGLHG